MFKNSFPSCLYWVLLPIDNLRQAVETAKRILTKEKLDRQLARQSTGTPLLLTMKEENEQRHKAVEFNKSNIIGAKIDKLTSIIGKLTTQKRQSNPFKPRVYRGRG